MSIVATMTTQEGIVFFFDLFRTPDGRVPDVVQIQEEELQAIGVDGRRFRTINNQRRPFTVQTLETCANYAQGVTRARAYDAVKGTNVRLNVTNMGGTAMTYKRVHVMGVTAVPVPGAVAGATTTSDAGHIMCDWQLVVMEVDDGANA